jgi:poly-gamma-glutamate synthesis protein (capsule biosynthesis protein)
LLVEFEQLPEFEHLSRFICHRVWQLDSPLIEGIHLVIRPVGQPRASYDRRIRVLTPALRCQRQQRSGPSPMPPRLQRKPRVQGAAPALKTFRAAMLSGSAVAAFILGCAVEVVRSGDQAPSLPFQRQVMAPVTPAAEPTATLTVSHPARESDRPRVVNAALEPVAVIPHEVIEAISDPTVTLVFGGDVTLDDLPYRDLTPDQQLLAGVSAYQQADVAMVSLNNPLAIAGTSLEEDFIERQRPDAINLLKAGGVDIVDLSSENTMTFGAQGLSETLETLDRHGIYRIGAGRHEREARRPEILDVKGQRIAYLSYNQADFAQAYGDIGGINSLVKQHLVEDIRAIRGEVDWLVVNYRWQTDLSSEPADWQTNLARFAIDQGADVVIGHHPQQLQGTEIYRGRPIAYSLGDLVFGQTSEAASDETAVLKVSLGDRQMKVELLPIVVRDGQPHQAVGAKAEAILQKVQAASQPFPVPMEPVMVLDIRPDEPTAEEPIAPDGSFVVPAEAGPGPGASPKVAPSTENLLPEESVLEEWGPKTQPGEEFAPIPEAESPFPSGPVPTTSALPVETIEALPEQRPSDQAEQNADEAALEPVEATPVEAISPHSEPLIGPLSMAIPAALETGAMPPTDLALGRPQTQVFKPLNPNAAKHNLTALADGPMTATP